VGLLTLVLACWVQWREPRRWVRRLAWAALALVLVQGLLGGLRVRLNDHLVFTTTLGTVFGVTHATLAQLFLSSLIGLAWAMSSAWRGKGMRPESSPGLRLGVWMVTGLIFVQLLVAATMRHQHAGLAVPDFPLAHGHWYPPTDPAFLEMLNARRMDYLFDERITAFHIHVHMVHRFLALVILAGVLWMALRLRRVGGQAKTLGAFWGGIIFVQFGLGIATVLSHKAADLATAHVAVGALSLVSGVTTGLLLCRWAWQRRHSVEGGLDAAPVKVGRVGNLDWAGTAPTSVKAG
jgi:cytochrome c oxidase assembly protein subunit 15